MHIQHLGLSSFKFITKDATVVTDPFGKDSGLTPPRGNADIVILAAEDNELYSSFGSLSGSPFLVSSPGEYDVKGVTITGIPLKQAEGFVSIFLIESEGIKVLNLTHIKEFSIKEDELEDLGEIDVLIIPVGGEDVLGASEAAKIVNQIEAKIVIPSHYATDGVKIKLGSVDRFVKEMGGKVETMDKVILKKKELASTEETKVIILTN